MGEYKPSGKRFSQKLMTSDDFKGIRRDGSEYKNFTKNLKQSLYKAVNLPQLD